MLVLSRREDQKIIFPNLGIAVEVLSVNGKNVKLGVDAPRSIRVLRAELNDHPGDGNVKDAFQDLANKLERHDLEKHELRNYLNTASLSVHVAQKMLGLGNQELANKSLTQAFESLKLLNGLLGSDVAKDSDFKQAEPSEPARNLAVDVSATCKWSALVVDDNDNERELLAGVLRMAGFEVTTVADGLAAIEHLSQNEQPDVVLMDMNMPRMDGPQAVATIRNEMHNQQLPIFAVSGMPQVESRLPIGDRGVTGWFSKPVDPNALVQHLVQKMSALVN